MHVEYSHSARAPITLMAVGDSATQSKKYERIDYLSAAALGGFALALTSAFGYKKAAPFAAISTFFVALKLFSE